jgi:transketolase
MRRAFSDALVKFAIQDDRVLLLTGDHGYSLFDDFRQACPKQYINAGVAEQNMVGVAAGLAKSGFFPIVYGLSSFVPMRVLEQIKLDICYEQLKVLLIGDGAGVVYSSLGSSHQCTEDIAALRALPNISILSPADASEMTQCMNWAFNNANCPIYLRMGKADLGVIHETVPNIELGKLYSVKSGTGKIAFLATGSMLKTALEVSKEWENSSVWSVPFIKPLDIQQVRELCQQYQVIVVMEEHSIYGGLGSATSEIASTHCPTWICRIGIEDRFSRFCGTYQYLMREHRLDILSVKEKVKDFMHQFNKGSH